MKPNTSPQRIKTSYLQSVLIGAIAGLVLALAFAAGFFLRDVIRPNPIRYWQQADPNSLGYPLLDEVQTLLDQVYLREQLPYIQRQYAAIRGVLTALGDTNTFFIDPPVAQSEADALAGTYGGIGVQLRRNEAGEFVLYPFPDSPASQAGIQDGALLKAINGVAVALSEQQDAVDQRMRGEVKADNGVEITVDQPDGSSLSVFIEFAVIDIPSVVWRVLMEDERLGYIQILRFTNRTPDELTTALTDLTSAQIQALILDLRNNSGGLLEESVTVASAFLDGGIVTYEKNLEGETPFMAEASGLMTDLPLAVLINRQTASASELVAAAIRDRERGVLIGQTTFGKGTVQQIYPLSDGSSVHITSAEWLTPNRHPIDGIGLEPDISMIPDVNGRDVELGEAIRHLQANLP